MAIEWVVGTAVASMLVGLALGYFLPLGNARKTRVNELENALETAQQELTDYKAEVYHQFATTAEKFQNLDRSYQELHQQLARSSVELCGAAATPLLAAATAPLMDDTLAETPEAEFSEPAAAEIEDTSAEAPSVEQPLEAQDIVVAEAEAVADQGEANEQVPTLTERDADFTAQAERDPAEPARRESARRS